MPVKAFLKSNVKDTTMVFIGNEKNNYNVKLEILVKKLGIRNKILFLEKLSREEIVAAYLSADIFICSSLWEAQPLSILDAMNAGIPFISTDVGCVLNMPGGLIVKNWSEMGQKMKVLIEDEVLRKKLGEEGRRASEGFYSWELVIGKYESLIKKLVMT